MSPVGTVSYASAAVGFGLLSALLIVSWKGRAQGLRVIVAALINVAWAVVLAVDAWRPSSVTSALVLPAEFLRDSAWLIALASIAREVAPRFLLLAASLAAPLLCVASVMLELDWLPVTARAASSWLMLGGVGVSLLVFVLIEHIYRNANAAGRYAFKYLAIGLGGVYTYDLFLYSQATMLEGIAPDFWSARGLVNAALVPFIAVASRRNPAWSLDVFISRQVVVVSTALASVGAYLLLMSAGGYYVRQMGGSWGGVANLIFIVGALVVLATVLMSGAARRHLHVFVHKHFYRNKFDYRVEWLRFVSTLSVPAEPDIQQTCVKAMAQVFQSPAGVLFARSSRDSRYAPVAAWPMPVADVRGLGHLVFDDELSVFLRDKRWVVDLQEYADSPELYQNVAIPAWLRNVRGARMLSPVLHGDDLEGFVLLFEPPPPFELTYEDRDLLKTMCRHVALVLARNAAERHLTESRQFEAYHRLTAFMMHDLKNAIAQLNLVVSNASRHRHNPRFVDDAFDTVGNAAARMTGLMEQLRRPEGRGTQVELDLGEIVTEAVTRCADRQPAPQLTLDLPARPRVRAERARLLNIVEHVIRNAQDASPADSVLKVRLSLQLSHALLEVRDHGEGMTAQFIRDRLFRPFDSTKGAKGMGIGAYQVLEYVRALGGDVEVSSSPGAGTTFGIKLPVSPQ